MDTNRDTLPVDETDRQARLEQELEQIRQVNDMTEGVIESLRVTELNLDVRLLKSFFLFFLIVIVIASVNTFFFDLVLVTFRQC